MRGNFVCILAKLLLSEWDGRECVRVLCDAGANAFHAHVLLAQLIDTFVNKTAN